VVSINDVAYWQSLGLTEVRDRDAELTPIDVLMEEFNVFMDSDEGRRLPSSYSR
jgi:hypothetical protein